MIFVICRGCPVNISHSALNITGCIEVTGIKDRGLDNRSRAAFTFTTYTEFNSVTRKATKCKIKDGQLSTCIDSIRSVYNIDLMRVKDIKFNKDDPAIELCYNDMEISENCTKIISTLVQLKSTTPDAATGRVYIDFEQVTDKFGHSMAVKDDFVFIVKGSKYSVYSYSDYDSHTTVKISAASMTSQKENVTIQQFSANGTLLQTSLLVLHYYSNLTISSGLFNDLPDF